MDLEEWELLPDEGFLEINDDGGKKLLYSKASTTSDFQMNYFICPPKESLKNQFLPIPIDLKKPQDQVVDEKEATKIIPVESTDTTMMMMMMTTMPATTTSEKKMKPVLSSGGALGADQDPAVSQVFFKKMKETEFVDMKVESPRGVLVVEGSCRESAGREEGDGDPCNKEAKVDVEAEMVMNKMEVGLEESDEDGINIWRWSLTGIGAICSFGVAVCIIILSSHRKNKYGDGKLRFQMYTDDKRMKQQVIEEGGGSYHKKINEAMRAVRGVANPTMSMTTRRARITYGGYYDASSV
ncbi:UNVERIFIED_CONTAM: hypothetical protein Scaly_2079900 [Sesamum calycinum]|uniref:DUF6821 domain-containing protein n=1 Tax=Sesamum calycinum TaxID=2727403 RepID=A0AAW2N4W3_9LAMI